MDFETFGEHQWKETGIFEFFEAWVDRRLAQRGAAFLTPSQAIARLPRRETLSAPRTLSWADEARDLSAWQGNDLQTDALGEALRPRGARPGGGLRRTSLRDFRRLSTSDHFYYMATKTAGDGEVHAYFSPFESAVRRVHHVHARRLGPRAPAAAPGPRARALRPTPPAPGARALEERARSSS